MLPEEARIIALSCADSAGRGQPHLEAASAPEGSAGCQSSPFCLSVSYITAAQLHCLGQGQVLLDPRLLWEPCPPLAALLLCVPGLRVPAQTPRSPWLGPGFFTAVLSSKFPPRQDLERPACEDWDISCWVCPARQPSGARPYLTPSVAQALGFVLRWKALAPRRLSALPALGVCRGKPYSPHLQGPAALPQARQRGGC